MFVMYFQFHLPLTHDPFSSRQWEAYPELSAQLTAAVLFRILGTGLVAHLVSVRLRSRAHNGGAHDSQRSH